MRFAEYLEQHTLPQYAEYYISYRNLAAKLPPKELTDTESMEVCTKSFFTHYEECFKTTFNFIRLKYDDLTTAAGLVEDHINMKHKCAHDELSILLVEMENFAEFIRVNCEGYRRILKKYARHAKCRVPDLYRARISNELKYIEGLNTLIYTASRLKLKMVHVTQKKESGTSFIRKTNKYWIHNENLAALKTRIVEHLPVYVFGNTAEDGTPYSGWDYKTHDTCVSSVYLDNVRFELYYGRLHKLQGAEAIRIRWYGRVVPQIVFMERKRHEESWTGEKSKKLRFKIYESDVVDYINGNDVWHSVKKLNSDSVQLLYLEIQNAIINKGLRPMLRTFYKRTAFQLPNDSSVRISLDTHLSMICECSREELSANAFPHKRWYRPDIICEWPFAQASELDVVQFPHAILEVKTQGVDNSKPKWIESILDGVYAEHVHKFSKYMHGCAMLFPSINIIPYWLPQIDTDIRKDPYHRQGPVKLLDKTRLVSLPGESENISTTYLSPVRQHGKKIAMPGRIEPKIHMANERTFLKWIKFATFLGGVGTTMSSAGDHDAWVCGCILNAVAMVFSIYACFIWYWRNIKIHSHDLRPYDDRFGPTLLIIMYIVAIFIIVVFKYLWTIR